MKPILQFKPMQMRVSTLGEESSVPDLLGTQILQSNVEFHLDETDEIYEGYGRVPSSYPYRQYNCYRGKPQEKEMKTAILENDYLRAVFLPELGGRLWSLLDKTTGKNLLYTNDVIQFRNLAVRNAWFSGGVEWNIGIIGHTPFTTEPLFTARLKDEEGNPVLRMYEYERIRQVEYQMDFWLGEKDRYLNCRMRVVNSGSQVVPMYWWSNIAVPEYEGGRVIVPADKAFTSHKGRVEKVDIPMVNQIDVSQYNKIPSQVDYFFDIPEESPKYIANVNADGYGLLHMSTKRLRSRKLFCWGHNEGSDHWQKFLTDKAGRYIEIQAGLGKTQYGCIPMAPHTAWEWMEQYSAVQIEPGETTLPYEKLRCKMTEYVRDQSGIRELDQELQRRKAVAKYPAELVYKGSGYGALKNFCRDMEGERSLSQHLDYGQMEEKQRLWAQFMSTGILKEHEVEKEPDDFVCDEQIYQKLKSAVEQEENKNNWYAFYQIGVYDLWKGDISTAEENLKRSVLIKESPWAYHALACCHIICKEFRKANECIQKGAETRREDLSYVKESFRLLLITEGYRELLAIYDTLPEAIQKESRVLYDYLRALYHTGEAAKVYERLQSDETYILDDLREGKSSIESLWKDVEETLFGKSLGVPERYRFGSM